MRYHNGLLACALSEAFALNGTTNIRNKKIMDELPIIIAELEDLGKLINIFREEDGTFGEDEQKLLFGEPCNSSSVYLFGVPNTTWSQICGNIDNGKGEVGIVDIISFLIKNSKELVDEFNASSRSAKNITDLFEQSAFKFRDWIAASRAITTNLLDLVKESFHHEV